MCDCIETANKHLAEFNTTIDRIKRDDAIPYSLVIWTAQDDHPVAQPQSAWQPIETAPKDGTPEGDGRSARN